jgi:DNA polymerase/3'-5' exonuclease PolX
MWKTFATDLVRPSRLFLSMGRETAVGRSNCEISRQLRAARESESAMTGTEEKIEASRFPLSRAANLARKFIEVLTPHCYQIEIVGSIRRQKPFVKDIELLLVSRPGAIKDPNDFFDHSIPRLAAAIALEQLLKDGIIEKRPNVKGHISWGDENKLARHVKSGIPVDFFFTTRAKWFNSLVVRTGPKQSNQAIAQAAIDKGWHWHAYGDGFTRNGGKNAIDRHPVESEADCFHFVQLPYLKPEKR